MAADLAITREGTEESSEELEHSEVSELLTAAEESELIVDAELYLLAEEEAVSASLILQELTGVHRHLETFAPSGIVDLSDRGLRAATRDLLDPAALGANVAAGITALDLSGNELSSVPTSLTKPMAGLLELDLSRNWLTNFPIALCCLPSLTTLSLARNMLTVVECSAELFSRGLPRLQSLDLRANKLQQMPRCLSGAGALTRLDLSSNRLSMSSGGVLTDPFEGTKRLQHLSLADNGLLAVPSTAVWGLRMLEALDLSANRLTTLAAEVGQLAPILRHLALHHTPLRSLPPQLGQCTQLEELDVSCTPELAWPPPPVMQQKLPAILAWLRAHSSGPPRPPSPRDPSPPPPPRYDELVAPLAEDLVATVVTQLVVQLVAAAHREAERCALRSCYERFRATSDEHAAKLRAAITAAAEAESIMVVAEASLGAKRAAKLEQAAADERKVQEAAAHVAAIPRRHLEELRNLLTPPRPVITTLQAVHALLEASDSSGHGQGQGHVRPWYCAPSLGGANMDASSATGQVAAGPGAATNCDAAGSGLGSDRSSASSGLPLSTSLSPQPAAMVASVASAGTARLRHVALTAMGASSGASGGAIPGKSANVAGGAGGIRDLAGAAVAMSTIAAPWEAVRGTLQKNFVKRVQSFDAARISIGVCAAVRAALPAGAGGLAAVDKASTACGPLYSWACASLELAARLHEAAPLAAEIAQLELELRALAERRAATQAENVLLHETRRTLQAEREALRKEVEEEALREQQEEAKHTIVEAHQVHR